MSENDVTRLLLAVLRQDWSEAQRLAAAGSGDPETFVRLCREADVVPWVHEQLRGDREDLVGPRAMEALAGDRTKVRHDNLLLLAMVERALDRLLAAGVIPVALKGLDFLHRLYGRFDERTLTDVDLLIRPQDLSRTFDVLIEDGWKLPDEAARRHYIRSSHHLAIDSPTPIPVNFEIHWNLCQSTRFRVDPERLFDRAVATDVAGRRVLRLADTDAVAHLLLHHFTHYFARQLKWAVDIRKLGANADFDWNAVTATLREWDAATVAGFAVMHLEKCLPGWIPPQAVADLQVAAWRRALTAPLRSDHPLDLFRSTRSRAVQLYLAAVMLERPAGLPAWLLHRTIRDHVSTDHPLDAELARTNPERQGSDSNSGGGAPPAGLEHRGNP